MIPRPRNIVKQLCLVIMALLMGCTGSGDSKDAADGNSRHLGFSQTKGMADSLYSTMQFRDAYDLYLQLLDSKEAQTDSVIRLDVLNDLCMTSELAGHKAELTKWLQQLLDLAKQTGNDYYQSLALITMGQNLFYEGSREKGIRSVIEAIDLMEKTDRENTDHLVHGYLNMLASLYGAIKDYDNALRTNERNLLLTMQGTRWGAAQNQQLTDRRMALAKMASVLARMGRSSSGSQRTEYFQRADSAYAAWQAVQYEGNHTRDYFIVDYMKRRGRYQEAITIYNDLIQRVRQQGDTLGEMMNTAKWGLADVCQQMGRYQQAAELYEQVLEIQDTLKSRKARNTALELAAVYHAREQEQTIMDRFQLSKERVGAVFSQGSDHARLNNYTLQLRLEHAARLLIEKPEYSIAEVAAVSGFGRSSYFSGRFRLHYGMSPSDFRTSAASALSEI